MLKRDSICLTLCALSLAACANRNSGASAVAAVGATSSVAVTDGEDLSLPADAAHVAARLAASPRHGEWAMIRTPQGDSVKSWVVYPERPDRAPVVVVVHEIYGLSAWARGVADQLAADGFIAIAPDLLTMSAVPRTADTVATQDATNAIRTLSQEAIQREIDAVAAYGMSLPSAQKRYGIVGFCWGGGISFAHAAHSPALGASVVYYGVAPTADQMRAIRAPVLGLYAGSDARVDATIPSADSVLLPLGRTYVHNIFDGAGHGFLRQQSGMSGANMAASRRAWPATIAWFRKYLRS
ncbi:MAG: dienelactone hydrolase family protein [Gemmatimonadota bacterium]|nr:dienelactone hydrolase family protein [Gemmatimonadota bacterium]